MFGTVMRVLPFSKPPVYDAVWSYVSYEDEYDEMLLELVQPEEHKIDPGAEDGERDQQDHHIVKIIGLQAEILAAPGAVEDAQGET